MRRTAWRFVLATAIVPALVAAGCGGGGQRGERAGERARVGVELKEWSVTPSTRAVEAGSVTFAARNAGKQTHEFVALRTRRAPGKLPVAGAQPKTTATGIESVANIPGLDPGESRSREVRLQTGSYVLICNLPGHYQLGMRVAFTVR